VKTEFTSGIGIRGSVRSVQSSKVFRRKKISIGLVLSRGIVAGSLGGLGPGEKKRDFEA